MAGGTNCRGTGKNWMKRQQSQLHDKTFLPENCCFNVYRFQNLAKLSEESLTERTFLQELKSKEIWHKTWFDFCSTMIWRLRKHLHCQWYNYSFLKSSETSFIELTWSPSRWSPHLHLFLYLQHSAELDNWVIVYITQNLIYLSSISHLCNFTVLSINPNVMEYWHR